MERKPAINQFSGSHLLPGKKIVAAVFCCRSWRKSFSLKRQRFEFIHFSFSFGDAFVSFSELSSLAIVFLLCIDLFIGCCGTGGSITSKVHNDRVPKPHQLIFMSPSGVQKERMQPDDMRIRCDAGAVIHSHEMEESCLLAMLSPMSTEFRVEAYPKTTAELVWNHGINVRGDTWISAKTQVCAEEGLNYLILCCSSHGCLEQITTSLWCGSDTKQEHEGDKTSSYIQMSESLGVDSPSEILFLTDVLQEAVAAAGKKKGSKLSMLEKTSIPNARRRLCQRIMGSRSINSFWKI
ncbi:Probable bifunctional methylthioribulose-1-phosphate dehydratase/enolase-phosphatase E1 [Linum perenne]